MRAGKTSLRIIELEGCGCRVAVDLVTGQWLGLDTCEGDGQDRELGDSS